MGQKTPVPCRSGGVALLQSYVVLHLEVVVIGAQIHDTLYQTNDAGNVCPAKQQIQNTHTGFAQIELVDAQTAQQDRQKTGGDLALYRPAGIDAVIVAGLYKDLYRLTGLTVCALLLGTGAEAEAGAAPAQGLLPRRNIYILLRQVPAERRTGDKDFLP